MPCLSFAGARSSVTRLTLALLAACAAGPVFAQAPAPRSDIVEFCVPCHGRDGIARDAEVPHIAGQNETYLFNQMRAFRSGARRHPEMRYMTRHMTQKDLEALAAYFAALPAR